MRQRLAFCSFWEITWSKITLSYIPLVSRLAEFDALGFLLAVAEEYLKHY